MAVFDDLCDLSWMTATFASTARFPPALTHRDASERLFCTSDCVAEHAVSR
jgi:hypothetical protein